MKKKSLRKFNTPTTKHESVYGQSPYILNKRKNNINLVFENSEEKNQEQI